MTIDANERDFSSGRRVRGTGAYRFGWFRATFLPVCRAASLAYGLLASSVAMGVEGGGYDYESHTYVTGSIRVERGFDEVKADLLGSLASYTAAQAYERFDASEDKEAFRAARIPTAGEIRKPYQVYEIRWDVPIFLDTGRHRKIYRIGLGGGPGRHLIGEHEISGLHLIPSIHLVADGDATGIHFVLPSSQYVVAFGDGPEVRELSRRADERFLALIESLRE